MGGVEQSAHTVICARPRLVRHPPPPSLCADGLGTTNCTGLVYDPPNPTQTMWDVFNAFGGIVFAFSFSMILVEISDTIKDGGKGVVWHAKRGVLASLIIITFFYFVVSILGEKRARG